MIHCHKRERIFCFFFCIVFVSTKTFHSETHVSMILNEKFDLMWPIFILTFCCLFEFMTVILFADVAKVNR